MRRNPPPLYRAIGIDSSGRRHSLGAGPLAAMRETAMVTWMADPHVRSAYVVDRAGHSYLSLEPRDRARLQANMRIRPLKSLSEDAVPIADGIAADIGRDFDWRVYAEHEDGWHLLDVQPTLEAVRRVYASGRTFRRNTRLSKAKRKKLPLRVFVFPGRRAWPIENADAAHAAIQHLQMGHVKSASDYLAIMNFIRVRYPSVWRQYGFKVTWTKAKAAKAKARTSRRKTMSRKRGSASSRSHQWRRPAYLSKRKRRLTHPTYRTTPTARLRKRTSRKAA